MASPMLIRCSTGLGGARPSSLRASRPGAASSGSSVRPLGLCNGVLHKNKLSRRQEAQWLVQAQAGDGSGGSSGAGGSGSGGSGGGGGGDDEEPQPEKKPIIRWKAWQDRVAADPQFAYKVMIEQVIGVSASVIGDMASRPNWGLNELDFVFATLVVGSIVNLLLVFLLAPTASSAAGAKLGFLQKAFGEYYLRGWSAPTGHMFEPGFGLGVRAINFAYKGVVFAFIGLCAGLIGTATSNGLLALRKKMDPGFEPANEPPSVVGNASCWALHMGLSSNLRYQMLNGMDMVLQPMLPSSAFRILTSVVRGLNNMVGGTSFVFIAKALGVQKAAEAQPVAPVPSSKNKKGK